MVVATLAVAMPTRRHSPPVAMFTLPGLTCKWPWQITYCIAYTGSHVLSYMNEYDWGIM